MHYFHFLVAAMFCASCAPEEGINSNADLTDLLRTDTDTGPIQIPFGTYSFPDLNAPQMEALVGGKLMIEGNCLYLVNDTSRFIPIFPAEHTLWIDSRKEINILGTTISVGQSFETNGGYVSRGREIFGRLTNPVPSVCEGDEIVVVGTQAWTVNN